MPALTQRHTTAIYRHASTLPRSVWNAFDRQERNSNIMYPHALKASTIEGGEDLQLWITCSTFHSAGAEPSLDLVLSCTEGPLGSYPVFIFSTSPFDTLDDHFLYPRLKALADKLSSAVSPARVFSVFAPEPITRVFVDLWSQLTKIPSYPDPYYAAKLTFCTAETLTRRRMTIFSDLAYTPRLARDSDISIVAELCQGFASTSEPFTLTDRRAHKEAGYLIRQNLIWVLEVNKPGEPTDIASIVAVTRQSDQVAGITKVYTNPRWRKRGCAERLVRYVCQRLLTHKSSVVLYVAHDNPAASGVYHRVGFAGLANSKHRVEGVDNWIGDRVCAGSGSSRTLVGRMSA